MQERFTKKCVKVVKAKSAKVQGARAYARGKREDFRDVKSGDFSCVEKVRPTLWAILRYDDIAKKNLHENDRPADEMVGGCRTIR